MYQMGLTTNPLIKIASTDNEFDQDSWNYTGTAFEFNSNKQEDLAKVLSQVTLEGKTIIYAQNINSSIDFAQFLTSQGNDTLLYSLTVKTILALRCLRNSRMMITSSLWL